MRAVIHSRKHYVQLSLSQVSQGALLNTILADGIEGTHTDPNQVSEGAGVKAVWVEAWAVQASSSVIGSFTAGLYKNPGNTTLMTTAQGAALHDYPNKKNIFYVTQGISPTNDSALMLIFKGWIKIPKGKQRMGLGDQLVFFLRNNNPAAVDIELCGMFIYKEYS